MQGNGVTRFLSICLILISLMMFERLGKLLPKANPEASRAAIQQGLGFCMVGILGLTALLTVLAFRLFDHRSPVPRPYTIRDKRRFRLMNYATVFSMILGCLSVLYFLWRLPSW